MICREFISFVCLLAAERVTLKVARKAWSRELKLQKEVQQEDWLQQMQARFPTSHSFSDVIQQRE